MDKNITLGEMFSGPGGMAVGIIHAVEEYNKQFNADLTVEHLWAIDNHPDSCETFRKHICKDTPDRVILADVRDNDQVDLEKLSSPQGFTFGFPCNDFSNVGERKGLDGHYGPLYTYGVKVLDCHNPIWFIAENVGGLEGSNGGNTFVKILNSLENAGKFGYELTPHLYHFEEYGVPQTRHRIIIVGIRKDQKKKFLVPKPTHINNYVSVKEVLDRPLPLDAKNTEYTKQSMVVMERLSHIKPGENAWTSELPKRLRLNVKGAKLSQIYKRLDPTKPSYTITGSGGGGTHVYHWEENRALTNRERARIQTFPDNFDFEGSKESVRRQIGMAVPPDGIKPIFLALFKTLLGVPYDFVESKWDENGTRKKKQKEKLVKE